MNMRLVLMICAMAMGIGGCANLMAVTDLSSKLSNASKSWSNVGDEITASCERERTLNPDLVDCNLEARASKGLRGANTVLGTYFKALADASNETNFTMQPGLDAATKSFGNIPNINPDQVKAVSGLAGLLANSLTGSMRELTLGELIEHGAPKAQVVVEVLDAVVVPRLSRQLESERTQLSGRFVHWLLAQGDSPGKDPTDLCSGPKASMMSGTGYLLSIEYCRQLDVIETRRKALTQYQSSLREANKALIELQLSKTKLATKALPERLYKIGSDLNDKIDQIKRAFG